MPWQAGTWLYLCPSSIDRPNFIKSHQSFGNSCWNYESMLRSKLWRKVRMMRSQWRRNMWSVVIILLKKCPRLGLRWLSQMELSIFLLKSQLVIVRVRFAFLQDFTREKSVLYSWCCFLVNMVRGYVRLSYAASMEVIKEAMKPWRSIWKNMQVRWDPGNCPV